MKQIRYKVTSGDCIDFDLDRSDIGATRTAIVIQEDDDEVLVVDRIESMGWGSTDSVGKVMMLLPKNRILKDDE